MEQLQMNIFQNKKGMVFKDEQKYDNGLLRVDHGK